MNNINIVIFATDSDIIEGISAAAKRSCDINLYCITRAEDVYSILMSYPIDAVIVELKVPTYGIYELIYNLSAEQKAPFIGVVSSLPDKEYLNRAEKLGANVTYKLPGDYDIFLGFIKSVIRLEKVSAVEKP